MTITLGEGALDHSAVMRLQQRLVLHGFDVDEHRYGPKMTAAVAAFQNAKNLPVTGIVDDATWQSLLAKP